MRIWRMTLAATLIVVLVPQGAVPTEAAQKGRKGGAVATETLTIDHVGMKSKKPRGLKARTPSGQRKGSLGSWSKVDGLDVTWDTPSATGASKGGKLKKR